jgi:hypothetical protein
MREERSPCRWNCASAVEVCFADGHEILQQKNACRSFESSLKNEHVIEVAPRDPLSVSRGPKNHLPFFGIPSNAAKQAGEEVRPTQPVDRSILPTSAAVSQSPMMA